ncbi:hypothetical protein TKK_0019499 [Trichogramma kaykai]|uniref:3'-5' exonuclease domain-containing protein n=1 Tax=Trichogramma kaykai TaxID=54128 RepID=A0ABD2VSG8_9HYME
MDSSEYENARNSTLLFFLERLMDKGGPRSLHDLSCQFGAKGFTKEMRQIAGGSQSGLKKFLAQYPFLFIINGDYVCVNTFQSTVEENSSQYKKRDYAVEAVEYFSDKLKQYGVGTEVPIKSLLGHRSQASPEVRHISGQHFREFKDFLLKYPDAFVVNNDNVILKQYEGMKAEPFKELEPEVDFDPAITSRLLSFLEFCITQQKISALDQLFHIVIKDFSEGTEMFHTLQDFTTFLKMSPDTFHVQQNVVTFIGKPKPIEEIKKQNSYENNNYNKKSNLDEVDKPANRIVSSRQNNSALNDRQIISGDSSNVQNNESKVTSSAPINLQQQTLKQRINTLLIKTLADNNKEERGVQKAVITEAMKSRVTQSTKIVLSLNDGKQIVNEIMHSKKYNGKIVISVAFEGVNVGPNGKITLLQIGSMTGQAYIFDLHSSPNLLQCGLQYLLENENVLKVVHDCKNPSATLFNQFGITLAGIFDTQAAHCVIECQNTGKPVYKVKNITLNNLCDMYGAPRNVFKESLRNLYKKEPRYWGKRPLTRDMIVYACSDVNSLVPIIYEAMSKVIKPEYQELLQELCEEQILAHIRPDDVKLRKKRRKTETEVADLRKKMNECIGKNMVLSNREIRLLRHLDLSNEEKEKLKGSYKVARKLEKLEGSSVDKSNSSDEDDNGSCKNEDAEYQSLESYNSDNGCFGLSRSSEPPSLTESMQMVDEILADNQMDGYEKIERLEAILSAATGSTSNEVDESSSRSTPSRCSCACQGSKRSSPSEPKVNRKESSSQTISTGDIVITRIYYTEEEEERERLLQKPKNKQFFNS